MTVAENKFSTFTDKLAMGIFCLSGISLSLLTYSSALVLYCAVWRNLF